MNEKSRFYDVKPHYCYILEIGDDSDNGYYWTAYIYLDMDGWIVQERERKSYLIHSDFHGQELRCYNL